MLFASRYHEALPARVARTVYRLTHARNATEHDTSTYAGDPLAPKFKASVVSTRVDAAPAVFNMDCLFPQYTYEYAIPYEYTSAALRAMRTWLELEGAKSDGVRPHFPIEVRFVDADGIWLSHCYGRKTCFIGLVQFRCVDAGSQSSPTDRTTCPCGTGSSLPSLKPLCGSSMGARIGRRHTRRTAQSCSAAIRTCRTGLVWSRATIHSAC